MVPSASDPLRRPSPGEPTSAAEAAGASPLRLPLVGRRRTILINPRYQLRALTVPTLVSVAVVAALILTLFRVLQLSDPYIGPELSLLPWGEGASFQVRWLWNALAGSAAFGALLVFVGLVETHRSAGAIFKVQRHLERVTAGRLDARVHLRRGDHFQDFADDFNRMVESLREAQRRDLEEIHRALDALGPVRPAGSDPVALRMAGAWDSLVELKHRKEQALQPA